MLIYIKNETGLIKNTKKLDKYLESNYKAVGKVGLYEMRVSTLEAFNTLIRDIIKILGHPFVHPFITPYQDSFQVNLRLISPF